MSTTITPAASASEVVRLERHDNHVALVTLNRPAAHNAINAMVAQALDSIVAAIESDPDIWVVVLAGAGQETFCAGADLKEVAAGRGAGLFTANGFAGFVDANRRKPWIAAVNGRALAGGCEIALACDMVVASPHASFGLPEVSRGLIAAAGGLYRLARQMPRNLAIELALTGKQMSANRAAALGLVNQLAPPGSLLDSAFSLASEITRNAPVAVCESLQVMRRAHDLDESALRELTQACRNRVAATDDYREGPRAFVEKRLPRWTGR